MKNVSVSSFAIALIFIAMVSCKKQENDNRPQAMTNDSINFTSGYSNVNEIKIYYEIYGKGKPLVLIHGGGSTIQSSFEKIIPSLALHFTIIAVELQNHGRSDHRDIPETFQQDADDVVALLKNLRINKASFFGFSNGGQTSFEIALRHPEMVDKLVVASSPYKRSGFLPGFFEGMNKASLANMPQELKAAFMKVNHDSAKLKSMFRHDCDRMINFKGWSDEQIKSITSPTLLINGDTDIITPEHAVEMYRTLPHAHLVIFPGGHGTYMGEGTTPGDDVEHCAYLITKFLTH